MTWILVVLGVIAAGWSTMLGAPPSRELMIKLGTLLDWARRQNPSLYASRLAPLSPFVGKTFKHNKLKGILRADLSEFGEVCQRLQRDARKLDVRAHYGLIPIGVYLTGLAVWFFALKS